MIGFLGLTWVVAPGCMGPYPFAADDGSAGDRVACDGVRQPGEGDAVDGVFDRDHDGFVDGAEPGCAEAWAPHLLDCDDSDPAVRPGATEVPCNGADDDCDPGTPDGQDEDGDGAPACLDCDDQDGARSPDHDELCWDGIDNDCDEVPDPDCPDYGGTFALEEPVRYACAFEVVNLFLDEIDLRWTPPTVEATNASASQPAVLTGTVDPDGNFVLEDALPGACDEYYRLSGRFDGPDRFEATFEARYLGSCFDCENQLFPNLVGHRVPD